MFQAPTHVSLDLFFDFEMKIDPSRRRRAYTTSDIRDTQAYYTEGHLDGRQMAERLGRTYNAFRQFVHRHPILKKQGQVLNNVETHEEGTTC
ncbi:hypothetical protein CLV24_104172 [Pontibacter ummariensis]|uniref:Uncharacterized protein n=1 Tax=Pontibacter ummariensis TaxID=1610492 RepID=A0A239DE06_9BACT|nr:hypothetical protein CLV24_104172 [Pontibacter ummariensis]SNS30151.1 hypothetical protein SAMN06296052_104171 [Pontibacter ummariensis]